MSDLLRRPASRLFRAALAGMLSTAAACDEPTDVPAAWISLDVVVGRGVQTAPVSQYVIHIEGPTEIVELADPGSTRTFGGLQPGIYRVALEGITYIPFGVGVVETFGEAVDVHVAAGSNTRVTIAPSSFVPQPSTSRILPTVNQIDWAPIPGATEYRLSIDRDSSITNAFTSGTEGTAYQLHGFQGTWYVRVRARNRFGTLGVPSRAVTVNASQ